MRFQDASTTEPRPPTVAEARARERAERKHQEIEEARLAAEEKRRKRNRRLIGGAAVVGVVGLVAGLGYWALSSSNRKHVTAQCVQDDPGGNPVVVPDSYCTGHTAHSSGFFYYGGHGYRYYYGSSGDIGQRPTGGSTVAPKGATITTKSGSPVQRGGLGSSGSSKGGGS